MSEDINTNAAFGQKGDDQEEEPIIVAQRFLNIFRQLHIFSSERKEAFNQMILDLPPAIRGMFKTLPGGSVLQDYVNELEKSHSMALSGGENEGTSASKKATQNNNILQNALAENQTASTASIAAAPASKSEIINSDNFAKILANSLAQSNAQIIRELQNNRPIESAAAETGANLPVNNGPVKLVADETFTQTIASALADAIANSEQKRQEDNKIITQSFLELQENLNKMMEQNTQLKIISNSDAPAEAASAFQIKNVVDDLVKAQSKFLRETTQSQKEELSSIISVAIKESLKLSTQSLIDSFKKMEQGDGPAPITYAAASPKKQASMENVEEALKAQGREFSSIIASALRESQQNSAQAIIRTIESLKGTANIGNNSPKVEDVMKMQADLFRDIARAQNQEFSNLISAALQESQKQSTQAIIAALSQMQGKTIPYIPQQPHSNANFWPMPEMQQPAVQQQQTVNVPSEQNVSLEPEPIISPDIDYSIENIGESQQTEIENANKKKKKKKKKNRDNLQENPQQETSQVTETPEALPQSELPIVNKPLPKKKTIISALPEMPVIEDKPQDSASDWGFSTDYNLPSTPVVTETEEQQPDSFDYNNQENDDNSPQDWNWEYQPEGDTDNQNAEESSSEEGEDWEWDYEEVPEGEDIEGTEGEDWEWDYEEIPEDESNGGFEDPEADLPHYQEDFVEASEIVIPDNFELLLVGMEDNNFQDPYLENNDNIG